MATETLANNSIWCWKNNIWPIDSSMLFWLSSTDVYKLASVYERRTNLQYSLGAYSCKLFLGLFVIKCYQTFGLENQGNTVSSSLGIFNSVYPSLTN